jgi:bifunctional non-homologous end joining protein LigD
MPSVLVDSTKPGTMPRFVVQKHWARSLHYDFRLEVDGRLVSWAVPKGPSKDPKIRRLAIRVPDHPLDHVDFEGARPQGERGVGAVMVWDLGNYEPLRPAGVSPEQWLDQDFFKFILRGKKLRGLWEMLRYKPGSGSKDTWLWVKLRDRYTQAVYDLEDEPRSALSGRSIDEIRGIENVPPVASREPPLETWARACAEDPLELGEVPDWLETELLE